MSVYIMNAHVYFTIRSGREIAAELRYGVLKRPRFYSGTAFPASIKCTSASISRNIDDGASIILIEMSVRDVERWHIESVMKKGYHHCLAGLLGLKDTEGGRSSFCDAEERSVSYSGKRKKDSRCMSSDFIDVPLTAAVTRSRSRIALHDKWKD